MSLDRRLALENLKGWSWSVLDDKWEAAYLALKNYD